jgi:hypothetical protein
MPKLLFSPSVLVSALHAAEAAGRGLAIVDPRLAGAIDLPTKQLAGEIAAAGLPPVRFWRHLIPLAARIDSRRQLVEMAVVKTVGRIDRLDTIAASLMAAVAAADTAVRSAVPNLLEELQLREGPIRQQWEARGPGMLAQMALMTDETLLADECQVVLIHPALGGGGEAHLAYNQVRLEAVLANPLAELPEVVRLGWLAAQVQLDLPALSEQIHADRLPLIAGLAMLAPVLAAAEYVELARFTPETLRLAVDAWRLPVPGGIKAGDLVLGWWQTYQETRPPWPVALAALDQMLA